ncbi:hypothetical protein FDI11_gp35 [Mycobacterium phage Tiger]|uniref:Uncharacterized protein n=3 Tax=Benedictvirus TaxID=2946819 RepID=H9NCX0_9CAUD|nr:hypothetical protein X823_gp35 [Mycobacterium phage Conspiracy]YP_008859083.1 hypothetical protein X816_gp33 [Mycobacterium phage Jovo]YP_009607700.1 hypothetical protein FDI11_gp35 [Mycobacterium phage Tiger]YP_010061020.1 hypothetical protein KIP52_gp25 [Mycobacterium phage Archetta]ATW60030.1 hypothetical protein SEA_PHLORENCE_56 [Mycobacterium phage Phlorence]ATW60450.1 hypothetical protein SEA_FORGETIT_58 [Mycobacterium phage ForGetIt]ATW61003.1 hypothetical protein SEA_ARAGOG_57 [Myc
MPGPMSAPNGNALITISSEARRKAGRTGKTELVNERKDRKAGKK